MKEKLTHITDNEFYVVDSLTHSIPYLVPRASALLDTIGSNFLDSLTAKGLNPNQVIVTSVLRTENDVKRLRPVGSTVEAPQHQRRVQRNRRE